MGISERLTDVAYIPAALDQRVDNYDFVKVLKCPVKFTDDPLEYAEGYIKYKLKPIQRNVLIDLFSTDSSGESLYNHAVFIAGMRCLGLGTEVLMYDGSLKKIEDIVVGDLVMGPDSKPRKVLETDRGTAELYKVSQSHAMTYIVNSEHVLSLKGRKDNSIVNIPIKEYLNLKKYNKWCTKKINIIDIIEICKIQLNILYKNISFLVMSSQAYKSLSKLQIQKIEKFGKSFDQLTKETVKNFLSDSKKSRFKI